MTQRKVLIPWRNNGAWLANNAFENKAKPPIKRKSVAKPKTPSPSPRAKRAIKVKSNFEQYWKAIQPENRQMIRNYVAAYKSPSPIAKNSNTLANAKRNVNALKTAKNRKHYKRTRAVNMNQTNWTELGRYIALKNSEAQQARAAKKSVRA
jgi:hypothetical protein